VRLDRPWGPLTVSGWASSNMVGGDASELLGAVARGVQALA